MKVTDRVAHDHFVAIPVELNSISCHFWRGCGGDYIDEFNPNYVIYNPNYSFLSPSKEAARLGQYVQENNMMLVTKIRSRHGNFVDANIDGDDDTATVFIYRKP